MKDEANTREGCLLLHGGQAGLPSHDLFARSASVMVEGGTISAIDAAAITDPNYGPDEIARLRGKDPYGTFGTQVGTYGDGIHDVLCAGPNSARTAIFVFF